MAFEEFLEIIMNEYVLSSMIEIISGGTPKTDKPEYWNGNIGWLSVADFNNVERFVYDSEKTITPKGLQESNTKLLKKGDVIISARGTVGALAQIGKEMAFNQSCFGLRAKPEYITNDFLFYALKNYIKNFKAKSTGSVFETINISSFDLMKLSVPCLKKQQSIAAVLSALDKKIALNKQINARLEDMAKTLYDYWFVQFDFPDANGKPYKSSGGDMVFDETLKREIPKGWVVKKLKDAMQIVRGASPRPIDDFLSDNGIPWIKISDATATSTPFIFKTKEFIKSNGKQYSRYLYPNTLILSNSATPGIPRIVELECCVHDGWLIIENLKNSLFNEFMYFYFLNFKEKIMNLGSGSIFKNLKTEYIKELDLIIPNKETLENAKTIFSDVFKKIKNTQKQNHHLIQLRDFLLPMLMNGQVSVAE